MNHIIEKLKRNIRKKTLNRIPKCDCISPEMKKVPADCARSWKVLKYDTITLQDVTRFRVPTVGSLSASFLRVSSRGSFRRWLHIALDERRVGGWPPSLGKCKRDVDDAEALQPRCFGEFRADVIARDTPRDCAGYGFPGSSLHLSSQASLLHPLPARLPAQPPVGTSAALPFDARARFSFSLR